MTFYLKKGWRAVLMAAAVGVVFATGFVQVAAFVVMGAGAVAGWVALIRGVEGVADKDPEAAQTLAAAYEISGIAEATLWALTGAFLCLSLSLLLLLRFGPFWLQATLLAGHLGVGAVKLFGKFGGPAA